MVIVVFVIGRKNNSCGDYNRWLWSNASALACKMAKTGQNRQLCVFWLFLAGYLGSGGSEIRNHVVSVLLCSGDSVSAL